MKFVEGNNNQKTRKPAKKSFIIEYDSNRQCTVLKIIDVEGMYPVLWVDPEREPRTIIRTRTGVQMR